MKRTRQSILIITTIILSFLLGAWRMPYQTNKTIIKNNISDENAIKSVINDYFELRYMTLSTLELSNFDNLMANTDEARYFKDTELGKLNIEIKNAEKNNLRYYSYNFSLDFIEIGYGSAFQTATVYVNEENDVIYELSQEASPTDPVVSSISNLKHVIKLQKDQGQWKIVSDSYDDLLWRLIRETDTSIEEIILSLDSSKTEPLKIYGLQASASCQLPPDSSSYEYDRIGAVEYALTYAETPNTPKYDNYDGEILGGDCTNFVSQAIHEGGGALMVYPTSKDPNWSCNEADNNGFGCVGTAGWYYTDEFHRSAGWNDVSFLHTFLIGDRSYWDDGPEGCEMFDESQVEKGDLIQYYKGNNWAHSVIIVDIVNGTPYVASHSPFFSNQPFTIIPNYSNVRFIHIERIDGNPPVTPTSTATPTPIPNTSTPIGVEDEWILLDTVNDVSCNSTYTFPAVTAKQFKIEMIDGGGGDNRISFYGEGSSGAAWLANGSWQEVNNQTYDLYVGQERETNVFDPAIVSQQRFSVGCNDGETMTAKVYYRLTYGATPTLATFPTTTLTVAPTPVEPTPDNNSCVMNFLAAITSNDISNKLASPIQALINLQGTFLNLQLFHRVEDEILSQTPQGEEYIALYYEHSPEIIQILIDNPTLKDEAIDVLQMWEPNLQALVDGQGDTVTITNTQVQAVQDFLDNLSAEASPELQQVIADEQLQQPLGQFINVTMDEALEYVEDGVSQTATPTFTVTPTLTFTPSPTNTVTPTSTPTIYTLVLQPNSTNGSDTYILSTSATTNYGNSADMGIGENNNTVNKLTRSLIKFDLSALPTNATIISAKLSLWTSADFSNVDTTYNIYRLKIPFNETQATWNRAATGVNWQTAGASGVNDRESISIGSVQILANEPLNIEKQIILDNAKIQELINGLFANNGFILVSSIELNDRFDFKSSDTSTATQRPMLVIQYTIP